MRDIKRITERKSPFLCIVHSPVCISARGHLGGQMAAVNSLWPNTINLTKEKPCACMKTTVYCVYIMDGRGSYILGQALSFGMF